MHAVRKHVLSTMLLALLLALLSGRAGALSYVMMSDESLLDSSPLLVRAEVVEALPAVRGPGGIESRYLLRIDEQFKGSPLPARVELALPGGVLASGIGQISYGVPSLRTGHALLLFAEQRRDGVLLAEQLTLGLFLRGAHQGLAYYTRALDSGDDQGQGRNAAYHRLRDALRFEAWLRDASFAKRRRTPDYLIDDPGIGAAKFNLFLGTNLLPIRWFQFDTNTALNWVSIVGGQTGMVQDEFAMITAAANALTNDPGSKLTVTHSGGTIPSADTHCDNGTSDGHAVLWNDPGNVIAGTYNCGSGGILANGGPCFFETATLSNGQPYNEAFEGRIRVQDGVACYFDGDAGKNGAEVMLHEMGHVIGLGHSCGDAQSGTCGSATAAEQIATMRATAFGDGRGASLKPDDQAALALVYPAAPGVALFANGFE